MSLSILPVWVCIFLSAKDNLNLFCSCLCFRQLFLILMMSFFLFETEGSPVTLVGTEAQKPLEARVKQFLAHLFERRRIMAKDSPQLVAVW